jgi:hypothetical protein
MVLLPLFTHLYLKYCIGIGPLVACVLMGESLSQHREIKLISRPVNAHTTAQFSLMQTILKLAGGRG